MLLPGALNTVLIGCILLCTFTVEGMTGFGSAVLALPFLLYLIGIDQAVVILVTLSLFLSGVISVKNWRYIDKKVLLRIVTVAGIGIPAGIFLYDSLPEVAMKRLIAVFMIAVGIMGIRQKLKERKAVNRDGESETPARSASPLLTAVYHILLLAGGIIHGAFGIGGPLIVVYTSKAIPSKESFRATMCFLWVCLNGVMTVIYIVTGQFTPPTLALTAAAAPFVTGGLFLGTYLHNKVSQWWFATSVNALLTLIGGVFLITG